MTDLRLELLIGTPILVVILITGILLTVKWWNLMEIGWRDRQRDWFPSMMSLAVAIGCATVLLILWFPYDMDYLAWHEVSGTVDRIDTRLVSSGSGMEEKYVVEIDGAPYACLDTRCAAVDPGDTLTLNCHKVWEWGSTHGWDCRFLGHEARQT